MEIRIKEFDIYNSSRSEWDKFHAFRRQYHQDTKPDNSYIADNEFEKIIQAEQAGQEMYTKSYYIEDTNKVIGLLLLIMFREFSPSYRGNEHNLIVRLELAKNYRRKGIGSGVIAFITTIATQYNKSILISNTSEEDGKQFLNAIHAKTSLIMNENRLYLKDVNWNLISSWVSEGRQLNPTTELIIMNKVPDSLLESYCKTLNFAGNQAPRDDLSLGDSIITPEQYQQKQQENEKAGVTTEICITLEKNGTISGLTEVVKFGSGNTSLRQNMTAVLSEYRGKKLGKWLKAAQLQHLKDKYPNLQYISTGNAESNEAMLAINTKLGFKKHNETIFSQITLEELTNYISTKNEMNSIKIKVENKR